jgi:hypothetical protein
VDAHPNLNPHFCSRAGQIVMAQGNNHGKNSHLSLMLIFTQCSREPLQVIEQLFLMVAP